MALYLAAIPFALAPIAYAVVHSFRHYYDLRYLWPAFGAFLGVTFVMTIGKAHTRPRARLPLLTGLAASVGAGCAGLAFAFQFGGTAALSLDNVMFSLAFGICWALSFALDRVSRPSDPVS
jgi:hypothetical protein